MELQNKVICFLGDSITEGVGADTPQNGYVGVLERQFHLKQAVNHGISGTRYARQQVPYGQASWQQDFCSRVDKLDVTADGVVVFGGTNDFGHGDAPLGSFDDRTPHTFYGACHTLYRSLMEKYPTKPILILTPLHRDREHINDLSTRAIPLHKFVTAIRQVAAYYGLPVLDLYKNSGMQPQVDVIRQQYMPDGVHPSNAGHARLANLIGNYLLKL